MSRGVITVLCLVGCTAGDVSVGVYEGGSTRGITGTSTSSEDASQTMPTESSWASETGNGSACGDGIVGPGEDCDGGVVARTCADLGFEGGTIACTDDCTWDTSGCHRCGDGVKNGPEECDGYDLGGATCEDLGWLPGGGGTPICDDMCQLGEGSCSGSLCGASLPSPPDGMGACDDPWIDAEGACTRDCPQVGPHVCSDSIDCPADRTCAVDCGGLSSCSDLTVNCAQGRACAVSCTNQSACNASTVHCPPDAPCTVTCSSLSACSGLVVHCPAGNHACSLTCAGQSACDGVEVLCGAGPCSMTCGSNLQVCSGATMQCGPNRCVGICDGASQPTITCGNSCNCSPCG
jgi:hypothetical protein